MPKKESILIIDDDQEMVKVLKTFIQRMGFQASIATDGVTGINLLKEENPDLLVTDLVMQPVDGLQVLREAKSILPDLAVIVMTGNATVHSAVEAMKQGASDYIQKPIDTEEFKIVITKAIEKKRLVDENRDLRSQLEDRFKFDNIIGCSDTMRKVYARIEKAAPTNASILISGESGTGKEMIARAIHAYSLRKTSKFVAVDCVALPTHLVESELFGYEKGAFTGANSSRQGLLETADKGTFFMDEVTELDFDLQAKLLRMLQERQFRRVGGRELIDVDLRIVSATKHVPEKAVESGKFREDLFYRLSVIPIQLSPLRERTEDIPLLIDHFLKQMEDQEVNAVTNISPDAISLLQSYSWPGNIRELKNMVERLSIMASNNRIGVDDLPSSIIKGAGTNPSSSIVTALPFKDAKNKWLQNFEQKYLEQILEKYKGNITRAAQASGVNRKTFQRLIIKYELDNFRRPSRKLAREKELN